MQMGRKFRLTARKNLERKKSEKQKAANSVSESHIVKIPLRVVSVFPVSIPISFPVSLPLQVFKNAPAPSVSLLYSRVLLTSSFPPGKTLDVLYSYGCEKNLCVCVGWVDCTSQSGKFACYKPATAKSPLEVCWTLHKDFSWELRCCGQLVQLKSCALLQRIPSVVTTVSGVEQALLLLQHSRICSGNSDEKFLALARTRRGQFMDSTGVYTFILHFSECVYCPCSIIIKNMLKFVSGTYVVAEESTSFSMTTIRHTKCDLIIESDYIHVRCTQCSTYRKTLQTLRQANADKCDRTAPDSRVNYRYLSTPEKHNRLQRLHHLQRCTKLKVERMRQKLALAIKQGSIEVDESTHSDLQEIVTASTQQVTKEFPENSFQHLFWDQQKSALERKDSKSMRWHPLMIKWCLYLRHISGRAYEMLRDSGCVKLPSQRTLRDYTHCVTSSAGFSADVDRYLLKVANIRECAQFQKNVAMVIDEMYIKEDLVYNKVSGALVGFANLGDINSHLLQFQASLENNTQDVKLAKTMVVFMVRGLLSDLEFPYAQFPCAELTGDLLFDPLWEAIARLERCGFQVLAVTADGGSPNRRLFKIHNTSSKEITYKVKNPYATDGRSVFFLSDPPHLIKTVRNCLASKKRSLWVSFFAFCSEHPGWPFFCMCMYVGTLVSN